MKFDISKMNGWLKVKEANLPGLTKLFTNEKTNNILIIGACVFDLYFIQNWIPPLKRKTGDIDLSVGVIGDDKLYTSAKEILVSHNYQLDKQHPYRFHTPKPIPGGYAYIDLLAHPGNKETADKVATQAMRSLLG